MTEIGVAIMEGEETWSVSSDKRIREWKRDTHLIYQTIYFIILSYLNI